MSKSSNDKGRVKKRFRKAHARARPAMPESGQKSLREYDVNADCVGQYNKPDAGDRTTLGEHSSELAPHDMSLLERSRIQWLFGDWESLRQISQESFQRHPDGAKLALLVAAAHLQTSSTDQANQLVRLARDSGCSQEFIGRILIAGVHDILGRLASILGNHRKARYHFQAAVTVGMPEADTGPIADARVNHQVENLGIGAAVASAPESFTGIGIPDAQARNTPKALLESQRQLDELVRQAKEASKCKFWRRAVELWLKVERYANTKNLPQPDDLSMCITSSQLKWARELRLDKRSSDASAVLGEILQSDPGNAYAIVERVRNEISRERWDKALSLCNEVINNKSVSGNQLFHVVQYKARAHRNLDQLEQAIATLEGAKAMGLESHGLSFQLARLYRDNSQWDEAEKVVQDMLDTHSKYTRGIEFSTFAARVFWRQCKLDQAHAVLAAAITEAGGNVADLPLTTQVAYNEIRQRINAQEETGTAEVSRSYYDEIYAKSGKYKDSFEHSVYTPVWEQIASYIVENNVRKIVDLGCGPGQFAEFIIQKRFCLSYIGLDYSAQAILNARQRCPDATFFEVDLLAEWALDGIGGDLFVILEVLEHMEDDLALLAKIPEGQKVVASVPNFDSFGHVRFFRDEGEVEARYGGLVNLETITAVPLKGRSKIFLVVGERSSSPSSAD